MADALGISASHYGNIEYETAHPSVTPLIECATKFSISLEWLKTGRGEMDIGREERTLLLRSRGIGFSEGAATVKENPGKYVVPDRWEKRLHELIAEDREKIQYAMREHGVTLHEALENLGRRIEDENKKS